MLQETAMDKLALWLDNLAPSKWTI